MADSHGGYRKPARPAPASGPGRLSKRTDGGPAQKMRVAPGGDYGDRQQMEQLQSAAPMGATPAPDPGQPGPVVPMDASHLSPLDAPTGAPSVGLFDNLNPTSQQSPSNIDDDTRARLTAYLPTLLWMASQPNATEQTRQYVRQLRGDL